MMGYMHSSTFESDGFQDAKAGRPATPPDIPVYKSEYMAGYKNGLTDNALAVVGMCTVCERDMKELVAAETACAMAVASVHGYITRGMIERRDAARARTKLQYDAVNQTFAVYQ